MANFYDVWIMFPQARRGDKLTADYEAGVPVWGRDEKTNPLRIEADSPSDVRQIVESLFPDATIRPNPDQIKNNPDNYKTVTDDGIGELDTSIFGGFTGRGFGGQSPEKIAREGWLEGGISGPAQSGSKKTRVMDSVESGRILKASSGAIGPTGEESQFFRGDTQVDPMKDFRDRWGSAINPGWGIDETRDQALADASLAMGGDPSSGDFGTWVDQYGGETTNRSRASLGGSLAGRAAGELAAESALRGASDFIGGDAASRSVGQQYDEFGYPIGGPEGGPQGGAQGAANELVQAINIENADFKNIKGVEREGEARANFIQDFLAGKVKGYEWIATAGPEEISQSGIMDMAGGIWNGLPDAAKSQYGQVKPSDTVNIADAFTPGGDQGPIGPDGEVVLPEKDLSEAQQYDEFGYPIRSEVREPKDFTRSDVTAADGTIMPFSDYAQQWGMEAASPLAAYRQGMANRFGGDIPGGAFSRFMESQYNPYLSVFQAQELANTLQPGGIQALQPTGGGGAMGAAADMQGVMGMEDPIIGFPAPKPQTFEQFTGGTSLPQLGQQAGALLQQLSGMGVGTDELRSGIPVGLRQMIRPEQYDQVQNALGLLQAAQQQRYSPIAARAFNPRGVRQEDIFADYIRKGGGATTPDNFLQFASGRYGL